MPYQHSSENNNHAIPNVVGFASNSNASLHRCALRSLAPQLIYRNRRSHDGRHSTSADQRSSLTTWPLLQQFFTQRRVPSFGRQSLERHVDRHSICTETGALRSSTTHHLGTRPQEPNARRFALLLQFTVVVSRFTLLRYRFTGYWLAICINERARPSLPSGRGGLSSFTAQIKVIDKGREYFFDSMSTAN